MKDFVNSGNFEASDYKQILKQDILDDHIYALTPARKIISLPRGATVVDFAFKIHSNVGEQMVGAKVNGNIVSYSHEVQTSDIIEILTKKNAPGPNSTWLNNCKTNHAKAKIKNYLKRKSAIENETQVERGTNLILQELKKRNLTRVVLDDQKKRNIFLKQYKLKTIYDGFEQVADHKISVNEFVDFFERDRESQESEIKFVKNGKNKNSVIIPGAEDIKYELAKCCYPVYGDEIVAKAKNGVAFKVHRQSCIEAKNNIVDANWNKFADVKNKYNSSLKIVAINNEKLLNDIINMLSTSNVGVVDLKKSKSNDLVTLILTISVINVEHIEVAIANIKKNALIKTIKRV